MRLSKTASIVWIVLANLAIITLLSLAFSEKGALADCLADSSLSTRFFCLGTFIAIVSGVSGWAIGRDSS